MIAWGCQELVMMGDYQTAGGLRGFHEAVVSCELARPARVWGASVVVAMRGRLSAEKAGIGPAGSAEKAEIAPAGSAEAMGMSSVQEGEVDAGKMEMTRIGRSCFFCESWGWGLTDPGWASVRLGHTHIHW